LSSTSLIDLKLNVNSSTKSIENKNQDFSFNKGSKKEDLGKKIVFSPITGFYCPLELRPLDGTIEIAYADSSQSIGTSIGNLFPDYEKIEMREAQLARANKLAQESISIARDFKITTHAPKQLKEFLLAALS